MKKLISSLAFLLLLNVAYPQISNTLLPHSSLLVIKKNKILKEYGIGDKIVFKLKNKAGRKHDRIYQLSDTSVILVDRGSIRLNQFRKIFIKPITVTGVVGKALIMGGIIYFVLGDFIDIDQPLVSEGAAGIVLGMGLALNHAERSGIRIHDPVHLICVRPDFPFHQVD